MEYVRERMFMTGKRKNFLLGGFTLILCHHMYMVRVSHEKYYIGNRFFIHWLSREGGSYDVYLLNYSKSFNLFEAGITWKVPKNMSRKLLKWTNDLKF